MQRAIWWQREQQKQNGTTGAGLAQSTGRAGRKALYTVLVGLAVWLVSVSGGQAQLLEWATQAGGTGEDRVNSIAVDGSGNSYVTGASPARPPLGRERPIRLCSPPLGIVTSLWPSLLTGPYVGTA